MASDDPDRDPFRLEEEKPREPSPVRVPVPPPAPPARGRRPREPDEVRYDEAGKPIVSEVPVGERLDPSKRERSRPGVLPDPPGWPLEALSFPFRGRGALGVLGVALAFAVADRITVWNAFVGVFPKIVLYVGLLRWQVRTVAGTATGFDVPPRPFEATDFEPEALKDLLGVALRFLLYLLPAGFLLLRPYLETPQDPVHSTGTWIGIVGLTALALLLAPVLVFGAGLGWRGIAWPWNAVSWLARGLVPCIVTGLGWTTWIVAEAIVPAWGIRSFVGALAAYGALRLAVVGFTLVGARGLGVLGRRFELSGGTIEPRDAAV
jgi:hypothetical protein